TRTISEAQAQGYTLRATCPSCDRIADVPSYAGFWVTRRSGGVVCRDFDDLDAVLESDTSDDLRQLICTFQPPPGLCCGVVQLQRHHRWGGGLDRVCHMRVVWMVRLQWRVRSDDLRSLA